MKKRGVFVLFLLGVVVLISFISASFSFSNYSVEREYSSQGFIKGWINLSLNQEDSDSLINSNTGSQIELLNFLNKNNVEFNCSPENCESSYTASDTGTETKTFSLNKGESKIIGIKFSGTGITINSINFSVESDASASCENQLLLDFLDNNLTFISNTKSSDEYCSEKNYGCFDSTKETEEFILRNTPYCQKMNLTQAPGFEIGTWIKKDSTANKEIEMYLYDSEGYEKAKCNLSEISTSGSEVSCKINYSINKEQEVYVCVNSKDTSSGYKIKGYSTSEGCGFMGTPVRDEISSYQIFARKQKFNDFGLLKIPNRLNTEEELSSLANNYLEEMYSDCLDGCMIPIKITSNQDQEITLSGLEASYYKEGGETIQKNFYTLEKTPAKISSDFQRLDLEKGNFRVTENPEDNKENKIFELKLNQEKLFSTKINITKGIKIESLSPLFVAAAYPTEFEVYFDMPDDLLPEEFFWDFGDNKTLKTDGEFATHTYEKIGNYSLKISIIDENGFESQEVFNITVESPKQMVNKTIEQKLENIENTEKDYEELNSFYKSQIDEILNLSEKKQELEDLKEIYGNSSSDEDYIELMQELVDLSVPNSIYITQGIKPFDYYFNEEDIDVDLIKKIGGGEYQDNGLFQEAIKIWYIDSIKTEISYEELNIGYDSEENFLIKNFGILINEKRQGTGDYYVILENLENLEFDQDYSQKQEGDYVYIKTSGNKKIYFSTTDDLGFTEIPLIISPSLINLEIEEAPVKSKNWILIISLVMVLIFLIGFFVYLILQEWYKKRYESHLFKKRNDLYNIINYIDAAKRKGINEDKIRTSLKKSGWNSEQISYALKKYKGKRTGMIEIIPSKNK